VSAVGSREEAPANVAEVAQQRQRNFTLFVKAYDEVRRAVSFLRWKEGDLDRIAPSLYSGRGNSNVRPKQEPQPVVPATPPAQGGTTIGTGAATAPAATAPASANTAHTPAAGASNGLPGASPFASGN
jgi:hypothetical protein